MYKVGEFSRITRLTVKALHYYDEVGILCPSSRAENGYRMYSDGDFRRAKLVIMLRELDFSIAEIREIVASCQSETDLHYFLEEKKSALANRISRDQKLICYIDRRLTSIEKKEMAVMSYKVEIKQIPDVRAACIRYKGAYSEVGKHYATIFREIKGAASGEPFQLYYDGEYREEADAEACVPISGEVSCCEATVKMLPGIRALCTMHIGDYESLSSSYKALIDYAMGHGIELITPSREIYLKGPGMIFKGNPEKYMTEIQIPIK